MADTDERYIVISADTHAGGSHAQYREYLDPKYRDTFDAWRGEYKNPFKDLKASTCGSATGTPTGATTTSTPTAWSPRWSSRHRAALLPELVLFAQPPDARRVRAATRRRPGPQPWMVDFQNEQPDQRAGIGQVFLNDVDDTVEDAKWCYENGLEGGVLVGSVPRPATGSAPLPPDYDPCGRPAPSWGSSSTPTAAPAAPKYQPARRCRSSTSSRSRSTDSGRSSTSPSAGSSSAFPR